MADELKLRVVVSSIAGNGIAKLDCDTFAALRLGDGSQVVVSYGGKSIELAARLDNVYSPATARLMRADMAELRVEQGMEVTVSRKGAKPKAEPRQKAKPKEGKPAKPRKKGKAASLDKF